MIKTMAKIKTNKTKKIIDADFLAGMVQRGFEGVDKRLEQIEKRFGNIENEMHNGFYAANSRLKIIEGDVRQIKDNFIYRYEFDDLMARVKLTEQKLKIESGK